VSRTVQFVSVFFVIACLTPLATAQTTFNFPIPIGLNLVGFAVVNPNAAPATATFRLYRTDGSLAADSTDKTVPAGGQLALLDSELFSVIKHEAEIGWIQVQGSTGIQAFAIGGDFVGTVDGGSPSAPATQQILPLFAGQVRVFGVNPGDSPISVRVQLFDANGNDVTAVLGPIIVNAPAKGMITQNIDTTSGLGALVSNALYARLTSVNGGAFVAGENVGGFLVNPGRDFGILPSIDSSSQTTELNFPHAISGQLGSSTYVTAVGVTNLGTASQDVTITFTPVTGSAVSVQRTLRGGGALREPINQLFNLSGTFQDGWIRVQGTAPLTGFVAYADTVAGGVAFSAPQTAGATALFFDHIADLAPWWTGIALLNPGNVDANVEVYAMTPNGALIGGAGNIATAKFVLPAKTKVAKLLSELIPATQSRSSDGGFVFVRTTNGVPIFGNELFFLRSGAAFANVAAAPLASGISFSPPSN
jgi:hypothetical protein